MPPRYAYWTIIADGLPTAFRAAERDELMPTFQRLRDKHPDAQMKWFARGKLWESPDEARRDSEERRDRREDARPRRPRESGERRGPTGRGTGEARGKDWRPGGEHRDPRQKYKDAKKQRNVEHRREKFAKKHGDDRFADRPPRPESRPEGARRNDRDRDRAPREKPHGDKLLDSRKRGGAWTRDEGHGPRDRQPRPEWKQKPAWQDRPPRPEARGERDRAPREKPHGDKLFPRRDQRDTPRGGDRKPEWQNRDRKPDWRDRDRKPEGRSDRPPRAESRGDRKPEWSDRKPQWGDRKPQSGDRKPQWGDRKPPSRDREFRPPRTESGGHARTESRGKTDWRDRDRDRKPAAANRPEWRERDRDNRPPREKPHGDKLLDSRKRGSAWTRDEGARREERERNEREPERDWRGRPRPYSSGASFARGSSTPKGSARNQGTDEPPSPPRPRGPNREPRPNEQPKPSPPPRPNEPEIRPSGPPERGRLVRHKKPGDRRRE